MLAVAAVGVHLGPGFLLVHAFHIGLFGIDIGAGAAYPSSHDVPRARFAADLDHVLRWPSERTRSVGRLVGALRQPFREERLTR
jgi:hypothetical protein